MGKIGKIIIAVSFIFIGFIALFVGWAINGFKLPNGSFDLVHMTDNSTEYVKKTVEVEDSFSKIMIRDLPSMDVQVKKSGTGKNYVEYYDCEDLTHEVMVKNGELVVLVENNRKHSINISINWESSENIRTTVYLSDKEYEKLDISASSGDIYVFDNFFFSELVLDASSGDITVSDISAKKAELGASSGEITINGISVEVVDAGTSSGEIEVNDISADNISLSASSGDIEVDGAKIKEQANMNTTSGEISTERLTAKEIICGASSGEIKHKYCSAEKYDIETTSGDVELYIDSDISCVYDVKTTSGSIDVPVTKSGAEGMCKIRTTSGDVEISQN